MTLGTDVELPAEVREVAGSLIAALGTDLRAILWHGSEARAEAKPDSDHDLIVILKRADDEVLLHMQEVFSGRDNWSTFVQTEEELRQYPATGRLQFHFGLVPLFGEFEPPPWTREQLLEDLRTLALNIRFECRYRLLHREPDYADMEPHYRHFLRSRNARMLRYAAKLGLLALKARELLRGKTYPSTREELRSRLTNREETALVDVIDNWAELRSRYEEDATPLAYQLDAFARKLVRDIPSLAAIHSSDPKPKKRGPTTGSMKRHFTATGFVVHHDSVLLHWHKRLQQWMPPGGHIEPDEDPVQAVLREIEEESGLVAEVIPSPDWPHPFAYPQQLPPPCTILIEDIPGPGEPHKHIDLIYFCRPFNGDATLLTSDPTLRWVGEDELAAAAVLDVAGCGLSVAVPEDVRHLALAAIDAARRAAVTPTQA